MKWIEILLRPFMCEAEIPTVVLYRLIVSALKRLDIAKRPLGAKLGLIAEVATCIEVPSQAFRLAWPCPCTRLEIVQATTVAFAIEIAMAILLTCIVMVDGISPASIVTSETLA